MNIIDVLEKVKELTIYESHGFFYIQATFFDGSQKNFSGVSLELTLSEILYEANDRR